MWLSSGAEYRPGEGRERALRLRVADLDTDVLARYVADGRESIARYGLVPGATLDLLVADLIDRGIVTHQEVALALLEA